MNARIPRVIMRHKKTGLLVDVVEAARDPWAQGKDELIKKWLQLPVLRMRGFRVSGSMLGILDTFWGMGFLILM